MSVYFLLICLGFCALRWINGVVLQGLAEGLSLDYALSLLMLFFFLPLLVLANSVLTLFFFLELASSLILYNFATAQNWAGLFKRGPKEGLEATSSSKYYFNTLFFQFWASFFSSALIIYAILSLYLFLGTTEWFYINFLTHLVIANGVEPSMGLRLAILILGLGLVLKLGVAPFFAYKVEIYRGLPLYTLFFYSMVYFTIFFTVICCLFIYHLAIGALVGKPLMGLCLALASISLVLFMFDSQALRNFFALSSLVNATNFLMIIFS